MRLIMPPRASRRARSPGWRDPRRPAVRWHRQRGGRACGGSHARRAELAALVDAPAPPGGPGFEDTVAAFDRCGHLLGRVLAVFHNLAASATSPALQAVQRALAGPLAAHFSAVYQDAGLFQRIDDENAYVHSMWPEITARLRLLGLGGGKQAVVRKGQCRHFGFPSIGRTHPGDGRPWILGGWFWRCSGHA